ncbi:hypothetical protein [uncultured Tenacibaculum sp.]|uniref:hypothetical protein n=1 Tax=uncultured Tenacibaculum sp. TaxID=174713 RepID=UPI00260BAB3F|nr:hypothetical protein [uncultured Tenacibaculum sp.]
MLALLIIGSLIGTFLLAFIIVKFVPLKLRGLVSILLLALAGYLTFLIYSGVMEPIKFDIEKKKRYAKVIDKLKLIREAQIKYKDVKNTYASNKDSLIYFIEKDSLAIIEVYNQDTIVDVGGGITEKKSIRKERISKYEPIIDYFEGKDFTNMFKVPDTDKEFKLETSSIEKVTGLFVPVFEASIDKESILKGLARHLVKQELEVIEADQIKGSKVSVGSLNEVSTGGNWPPYYDTGDAKAEKEE